MISLKVLEESINFFLKEDDLSRNFQYINSLPDDLVDCKIKFKDNMIISGLPFFFTVINHISNFNIDYSNLLKYEGRKVSKSENFIIEFKAPFNLILSAERLALNLLQKSSSISTNATAYVESAKEYNISILDTRKTTPGLRFLEKYATQVAGAKNHRFSQTDIWMIKDNHKNFFGGVKESIDFFKSVNSFYTPLVLEVHSLSELKEGLNLDVKHFMLDNFTAEDIKKAIEFKTKGITFEVSGGITTENLNDFLIEGVDAISSGSLTYGAKPVDISLKYRPIK